MMNEIIEQALAPVFAGVKRTDEVNDFYDEVRADLAEAAQDKMATNAMLSQEAAVKAALTEMGDLHEAVKMMADDETLTPAPQIEPITGKPGNVELTVEAAGLRKVKIDGHYTDVRLTMSETAEFTVKTMQRGYFNGEVAFKTTDGQLKITMPEPKKWSFVVPFAHPHQTIELGVPAEFAGELTVETKAGNVWIENLVTPALTLVLEAKTGNVRIADAEMHLTRVKMKAGNLHMDNVTTEFETDVKSGNTKVVDAKGFGQLAGQSGNLRVDWDELQGDVHLRLRSGNIKNVLPQTASFKFDAQSESGVVKVKRDGEFDVKTMSYVKGETDDRAEYLVKAQVKSGNVKMM